MSDIFDITLATSGKNKIDWVRSYMPILNSIRERFEKEKPFAGLKISMSIHLEAKTAYLAKVLAVGGATVHVTLQSPFNSGRCCCRACRRGIFRQRAPRRFDGGI